MGKSGKKPGLLGVLVSFVGLVVSVAILYVLFEYWKPLPFLMLALYVAYRYVRFKLVRKMLKTTRTNSGSIDNTPSSNFFSGFWDSSDTPVRHHDSSDSSGFTFGWGDFGGGGGGDSYDSDSSDSSDSSSD